MPGTVSRRLMAHLSVMQRCPLRKSITPSRRHSLHLGPVFLAMVRLPPSFPRRPYTRRRLRGRQPLWGIGVTSSMARILRPVAASARTADSRPEPGPLTFTSTSRTPIFIAFSAQRSAAFCAANGVDLREPLKPTVPAESQQRVSPLGSVIVTIVLLNDASTWQTPRGTIRLPFARRAAGAAPASPSAPGAAVAPAAGAAGAAAGAAASGAAASARAFGSRSSSLVSFAMLSELLHALLARHRLPGPLPRTRVRAGPLSAHRQALDVPGAAVALDLLEAAHVLRDLPAQLALDDELLLDERGDPAELLVRERLGLLARIDAQLVQDAVGRDPSDPVDVGERDPDLLLGRNVDSDDARHSRLLPSPGAACAACPCRSPARRPCGGPPCSSRRCAAPKPGPSCSLPLVSPGQATVRTSVPPSVTAIVCSKWALGRRSRVTTVHPSSSTSISAPPRFSIGSTQMTMPGRSTVSCIGVASST